MSGRTIARLAGGSFLAGTYQVFWPGTDRGGHRAPPGMSLVRLVARGGVRTLRVALEP